MVQLFELLSVHHFSIFTFIERGEVLSDHYKLLPVDLRDIHHLNEVIALAGMDPRYVLTGNILPLLNWISSPSLNILWIFELSVSLFMA